VRTCTNSHSVWQHRSNDPEMIMLIDVTIIQIIRFSVRISMGISLPKGSDLNSWEMALALIEYDT
jgi:hypothetical protein